MLWGTAACRETSFIRNIGPDGAVTAGGNKGVVFKG
jgi:hypothetical protein